MPILDLLKTTPALATMGTVGVGGTALTLWGTGVIGGEPRDYPEYRNIPQPKDAKTFLGVADSTLANQFTSIKSGTATSEEAITKTNDNFGEISTQCFNAVFGNMPFPSKDKFKVDKVKIQKPTEETKQEDTLPTAYGPVQGCSSMASSSEGKYFLMTSEAVIRKGNRGIALWTGAKNANDPFRYEAEPTAQLNIRHFMAFLSHNAEKKAWEIVDGFSWGGKDNAITFKTWSIKSPDNKIKENFGFAEVVNMLLTHKFYFGSWRPENKQTPPLDLNPEPYASENTEFTPFRAYGYKNANAFLRKSESGEYSWNQYCESGDQCKDNEVVKVDVSQSIDSWFKPFQDQIGSWS